MELNILDYIKPELLVLVPVLAPVLAVLEGAVWPQPASRPTLRAPASRRERAFFMSNAS